MVRLESSSLTLCFVYIVVLLKIHAARQATSQMEASVKAIFFNIVEIVSTEKVSMFHHFTCCSYDVSVQMAPMAM